jgi:hypothetical protein
MDGREMSLAVADRSAGANAGTNPRRESAQGPTESKLRGAETRTPNRLIRSYQGPNAVRTCDYAHQRRATRAQLDAVVRRQIRAVTAEYRKGPRR